MPYGNTYAGSVPLEILTDQSTLMNQTLTHLASISGIRHHVTIPYSKEENGIVERANKEVNRHIRNILVDKDCISDWPQILCLTEKLLNSSVKQALGVSRQRYTDGTVLDG